MRIAIDAMGGDLAPAAPVAGGVASLLAYEDVQLVLVGEPTQIEETLAGLDDAAAHRARIDIHPAPESVDSAPDPVRAVRATKNNSARACAQLLRQGDVDGVITMGNTGAAVAAATLYAERLPGVRRLGIAVPFPRPGGVTVVTDCGANPNARAEDLHQYAIMAREYVKHALGVEAPRTGILSIGEEEYKGNKLVADTWAAFRAHPVPDFIGNVEPREFFSDRADVVVADGFTGNVALKAAEGMAEFMLRMIAGHLGPKDPAATKELSGVIAQRVDYSRYGGAPLLGLTGGYLIGHGRSGPESYKQAVRVMREYVHGKVGERIIESLAPAEQEGA